MIICDRCGRGGDIHRYSFGLESTYFPGLISRDLCSDCAQALAKLFEEFTSTPYNEPSHYGTQEWQDELERYETECRERGKR